MSSFLVAEKTTQFTRPSCPFDFLRTTAPCIVQTPTHPCNEPAATYLPFGQSATAVTCEALVGGLNVFRFPPDFIDHTRTLPSTLPDTTQCSETSRVHTVWV